MVLHNTGHCETVFCWQCLWTVKTAVSTFSCINQLSRYLLLRLCSVDSACEQWILQSLLSHASTNWVVTCCWDFVLLTVLVNSEDCSLYFLMHQPTESLLVVETLFCWQCLWTVKTAVSTFSCINQLSRYLLLRLCSVDSACEQWRLQSLLSHASTNWVVTCCWDFVLLTVLVNSEDCSLYFLMHQPTGSLLVVETLFCWQCLWTVKTAVSTSSCINQLSRYLLSRRRRENSCSSSPVSLNVWLHWIFTS